MESCRDKVPSDIEQLGYIEPGHGSKGKLRWLLNDQDIEDMYKIYLQKREILLWCSARKENERAKKRTHSPVSLPNLINNHVQQSMVNIGIR